MKGTAYSRAEVYKSGVVTLPLQQTNSHDRLHAMNKALADYGDAVRNASANPAKFVPFEHMPGNSAKIGRRQRLLEAAANETGGNDVSSNPPQTKTAPHRGAANPMVGARGFEPPTSRSRTVRSNQAELCPGEWTRRRAQKEPRF